jgi:transposase, IS30 family
MQRSGSRDAEKSGEDFSMGKRAFKQLCERDRVLISFLKSRGLSLSEIARRIGKNKSTISRELRRNAEVVSPDEKLFWFKVRNLIVDDELDQHLSAMRPCDRNELEKTSIHWCARDAQARRNQRLWEANQKRRRKKSETRAWVIEKLKQSWSPQQIAGRSKIDAPEPVSHEYIYSMLYRDKKRGGRLYRLLKRFRKRKQRLGARTYPVGPIIPNRVGIEERPAIVDSRSRLGDCEGDLIVGYRQSGYILSLIDRKSKFIALRKLKTKRKEGVRKQLERALRRLGGALTLTLDNGSEFCAHEALSRNTKVRVYFAHPYCSSERGSIENANGLVRYFLPKKTSFSNLTQTRLNQLQDLLNHRPRKCLGYLTPAEVHSKKSPIRPDPSVAFDT